MEKSREHRTLGIREHITGMQTIDDDFFSSFSLSTFVCSLVRLLARSTQPRVIHHSIRGLWYLNSDIYDNVVSHHNMRAILMCIFLSSDLSFLIDLHNYQGTTIAVALHIFHLCRIFNAFHASSLFMSFFIFYFIFFTFNFSIFENTFFRKNFSISSSLLWLAMLKLHLFFASSVHGKKFTTIFHVGVFLLKQREQKKTMTEYALKL